MQVQKSSVIEKGNIKKEQDTPEVHITPGASGVKRSIGYQFNTQLGDGDPGNGVFRYDKDDVTDVNYIFVNDIDISGEDQTFVLTSLMVLKLVIPPLVLV